MSTPKRRPQPLRLALIGGAAAVVSLTALLLIALWPRGAGASAEPPAPTDVTLNTLGAAPGEDTAIGPIRGPSVDLLLMWAPGAETFTAPCAAPVAAVARYAHGPQYVRLDCDHDGLRDAWALADAAGVGQDSLAALAAESDTHLRPME